MLHNANIIHGAIFFPSCEELAGLHAYGMHSMMSLNFLPHSMNIMQEAQ